MKTLLILIKVFVIGALLIISNGDLALEEAANRDKFVDEYQLWLGQLFNHGWVVVGYVVGNEWLPDLPAEASP